MACSAATSRTGAGGLKTARIGQNHWIRRDGIGPHSRMQIDLAALPNDPTILQQMLRDLVAAAAQEQVALQGAVQEREAENDKLRLLIQRLLRNRFGRRSEQLTPISFNSGWRTSSRQSPRGKRRRTLRHSQTSSGRSAGWLGRSVTLAPCQRICLVMKSSSTFLTMPARAAVACCMPSASCAPSNSISSHRNCGSG